MLRILFLVFFLVASGSGAIAQSQQPPSQSNQSQRAQEERGSEKSPVVVQILPTEKSKDELDRGIEKQESDRQLVKLTGDLATYTKLLFIATGLLGFVTAGLVVVGFLQIRDAKKVISAAETSATAALKSSSVAERTLIDLERPYFLIAKLEPNIRDHPVTIADTGITPYPELKCTIKNYGRAPAILTQAGAQLRLSKDKPPGTLSVIPPHVVVIEPNGDFSFNVPYGDVAIDEAMARLLKSEERKFWLHFHFIYSDITGKSHETEGRWKYHFGLNLFEPEGKNHYEKTT